MAKRDLEELTEWESLARPCVYEHVAWPAPPFMQSVRKVTISRDDNFQLQLVAEGIPVTGEVAQRHVEARAIPLGSFQSASEIAVQAHGANISLKLHVDPEPASLVMTASEKTFRQHGHLYVFKRTWTKKFAFDGGDADPKLEPLGPVAWLSDWYVNGETGFHFSRLTKRRRASRFSRERAASPLTVHELPSGGSARDHIVVDTPIVRFTYGKVPDSQAPAGVGAVSIDFVAPLPDVETRTAVGEIVSFILGRRLMRVGATTFDASGWSIEDESVNPWADNVRALCKSADLPPVPYDFDGAKLEALLADLVPRYLAARESLKLKDALWGYWIAKESSVSIDLPIFAAAVESLKKSWFASTKSKSKGAHMPKDAYDNLVGDLVAQLSARIREAGAAEEIIKNIAGANRMGLGEQMRVFLEEIGLPIGAAEKAAMGARHRAAHGSPAAEEIVELVKFGNAYRTLFERLFLRLLGYEGHYVDRTTVGHPTRPLVEPAGGT